MPPTRGNKKVQQNTVKEMLIAMQAAGSRMVPKATSPKEPNNVADTEEENDDKKIILPKIFSEFVDIVPPEFPDNIVLDPTYRCTTMSRVWFRDHSNLDDILAEHMKYVTKVTHPMSAYTTAVMRSVISMPVRRMQAPYEKFRFNSPVEEIIGRTLLINPRIKDQEDLQSFLKFQNEHRLKICEVSMYQNNQAHEDAKAYYTEKRKRLDSHAIPVVSKRRLRFRIKRKFYERQHLVEDVFLKDLTLQQLESKSNFKSVITKRMAAENIPEGNYENFANIAIHTINMMPSILDSFTHFTMDPKYNLITNIMTREEQDEVAESLENFYMLTNANEMRRKFSNTSTKEEFYNMYRMRSDDDRKYPPYNHLYYDPNDDLELTEEKRKRILSKVATTSDQVTESLCNDNSEPSTSAQAEMNDSRQLASLQYKTVQRFVKNPELTKIAEIDDGNSSDTSRVTVLHQSSSLESIDEEPPVFRLPDRYLNHNVVPPQAAVALMKIMIPDKRFVFYVKQTLNLSYKKDFDSLWSQHKKFILINFFMEHWEGDAKKLFPVIDKLSKEVREKAQEMLLRLLEPQPPQQTATSIQDKQQEEQEGTSASRVSQASDVILISPGIPIARISPVIKQEKESPPIPFSENSDVQCLGLIVEQEIIISDSQDADDSLIASLQDEQANQNPFLEEINADSQQATSRDSRSNETLTRLRAFESRSVFHLRKDKEDKQQSALKESSIDNVTVRRRAGPRSKTISVSKPNDIEYLDDESQSSLSGNNSPDNRLEDALNDDFSVFLSTQLINAENENCDENAGGLATETNPFTFTNSSSGAHKNQISSDTTSFIVHLSRVYFEKGVKFELNVNLPQYTLYNIIINDDSIKSLLNVNEIEYASLINLLNVVEKYEFIVGEPRRGRIGDSGDSFIIQQLDMFFSTQIKFKSFTLNVGDDEFTCHDRHAVSHSNVDLTTAIHPEVLRNMSR